MAALDPWHPDQPLKCLLIQPRFDPLSLSFWNIRDACEVVGAKTMMSPLGLITVAALLPQHWRFRLLDLNAREFSEADWQWADLVCVGGMVPQQQSILAIVERANRDGKFVVVGGADPTSRPEVYRGADARVLGEAETSLPLWLESWRRGEPRGLFRSEEKPDVTQSPIPRYDLLHFDDYLLIGMQFSRGCPFRCEFCDIIEFFGRVPRTKTPEQMTAELETLCRLGYRGGVEMVDDNFVGNKRNVKTMLPSVIAWSKKKRYPFFFVTEASMNVADDPELLDLMRAADFRVVFMGIETPDPDLLKLTQKAQNTMKPIVERVQTLYRYGIQASAGFIMGFDNEKTGSHEAMIRCIEDTGVCMAAVELLVALPSTQLTRRLLKEGRLLSPEGEVLGPQDDEGRAVALPAGGQPHAGSGLNFITSRDRAEILEEFCQVITTVYDPARYLDRVLRTVRQLRLRAKHAPSLHELWRDTAAAVRISLRMTLNPRTRWRYWRNFFVSLSHGYGHLDAAMRLMAVYLDYERHTQYLVKTLGPRIAAARQGRNGQQVKPAATLQSSQP